MQKRRRRKGDAKYKLPYPKMQAGYSADLILMVKGESLALSYAPSARRINYFQVPSCASGGYLCLQSQGLTDGCS